MKTVPISKVLSKNPPNEPAEPGGRCDKCTQTDICKRINYCPGYKKKFGKWSKP